MRDRDDRDHELRGAMRDYPDHFGAHETGRDTWRSGDRSDRYDRRFDRREQRFDPRFDDSDDRFGDRSWSSERPYRSHEDERYRLRDDIAGYRGSGSDRMSDRDDRFRGQVAGHGTDATGGTRSLNRGPHHGKGPVGFQRSDERIKETACEALTDHGDIDASHIEVSVKAGEVTLSGTVEDRRTKRLAEDCVEAVPGVKDVHNQLRIGEHRSANADKPSDRTEHIDKKHPSS
jgi:osmotically-inducible protein OsmY